MIFHIKLSIIIRQNMLEPEQKSALTELLVNNHTHTERLR